MEFFFYKMFDPFECITVTEKGSLTLNPYDNHIGWMIVVAPTYRPKSVRNRCAIEHVCSVFASVFDFDYALSVVYERLAHHCKLSSLFSLYVHGMIL